MVLALGAAVTLGVAPAGAGAQLRPPHDEPAPRLRLAPFVAYSPHFTRTETRTTEWPDRSEAYEATVDLGAGLGGGATLEYRAAGRLAAFAGGAVLRRQPTAEQLRGDPTGLEYGSDYLLVRGGLGLRFDDARAGLQIHRVQAGVAAGPVWARELPRGTGGAARATNLWGVHAATTGELLLPGDRIAIAATVEDNVLWWNAAELARRVDGAHARRGEATRTALRTTASHHWLIRVGFAIRI